MSLPVLPQHVAHPRQYEQNRFAYPVLSRRSRGISIGVNLNPDKVCNFDCIYCQVDRRSEAETRFVGMDQLLDEVDGLLAHVTSGRIWSDPGFSTVPKELRRLNDIAFSGDGEPTTYRNFDEIISRVARLKRAHDLSDVKLVLITNASMFHRPAVERGLSVLDANNGEVWAKLDAGTEPYYQLIERTKIPFDRVLENIARAARIRPLVIQSLFMRVGGEPPPVSEIDAYLQRLREITESGGRIKLVQVYTVARRPAEDYVTPLSAAEVDDIADRVEGETGLRAARYYGAET
ncbi:MAG: radical SAM protein [Planctomycetota bacterium]|nr:MAG: radical SAM protein [Planctomycetota bacterium]REK25609.1 MAG: radical SAM protein [Planctomycetota bacterium]REK31680.1 MAG: radical SAM protein [Planctomycetota bacterium]